MSAFLFEEGDSFNLRRATRKRESQREKLKQKKRRNELSQSSPPSRIVLDPGPRQPQ